MTQKDRDDLKQLAASVNKFERYTYQREYALKAVGNKHEQILDLITENQRMRGMLKKALEWLDTAMSEADPDFPKEIESFLSSHP